MGSMGLSVVLADDHEVVRDGFRVLLEQQGISIAGEARNGHEAVRLTLALNPSATLMDLSMPELDGIDAARQILLANPAAGIILLTMHEEEQFLGEAVHAGIRGYVMKSQPLTDLVDAIHAVAAGGTYLPPRLK
jgi:two-component system response regulator NreC